jgi:hypothetical protein
VGEGKTRTTHRAYLESLASQGDPEAIAELADQPDLPRFAERVWDAFLDLSATRQSAGMGPSRITRFEVRLWEEDEAQPLDRWERRALMAIDAEWVRSVTEQTREASK